MIYIVEIPHRLKPMAWSRATKNKIIHEIISCSVDVDLMTMDSFDDYLEHNGRDLHSQLVLLSDSEAIEALANDSIWAMMHQGYKARKELENELFSNSVIEIIGVRK